MAEKIEIVLRAIINNSRNQINELNQQIDDLSKKLSKLKLKAEIDTKDIDNIKNKIEKVNKEVQKVAEKSKAKIKIFDKEELEKEGRDFLISNTKNIDQLSNTIRNKFKSLGKDIDITFTRDAKNSITGFIAEVKKADSVVEAFKYNYAKVQVGNSVQKGFVLDSSKVFNEKLGSDLQNTLNKLQQFEIRLNKIRDYYTSGRGVKDVTNLSILEREYNSILNTINKIRQSNAVLTDEQNRSINKLIYTLGSLAKKYRDIEVTAEKGFNFKQFENITGQIIKLRENLDVQVVTLKKYQDALSTPLLQGFRINKLTGVQETEKYLKLTQELQRGNEFVNLTAYIDKADASIYKYAHTAHNAMIDTLTWEKAIVTAFKRIVQWAVATSAVYGTLRAFRDMVNVIEEIDKALIEINKVLDLSNAELKELTQNATNVAKELGRTTVEVLNATAAFAKAGFNKEQSENMAKLALLLANVGDMSVDAAQETLIAANAGFQLGNSYEALMGIIDKMNEVANQNATEINDLSEALKVSAATAKQAGLTMDQYIALVGTASSVTQRSGSEIGNAWKTILMRITGVSDGIDTLEEDVSKAEKALNSIGIAVRKSPNEFRPVMDILSELAAKFNSLSSVEQSYVTEALAGKYRANILKSTLQNFDMVYKQLNESMNATGSALRENARYMESIEAKSKQLAAVWEKLAQTIINSDWLKNGYDFAIKFVEAIDNVIKDLGLLRTTLLLVTSVGISKFLISMWGTAKGASILETAIVALQLGVEGLSKALLGLVTNPVTALIAVVGVVTFSIFKWADAQQRLKQEMEATAKAQEVFNNTIDDFNNSLDVGKIDETSRALEDLKKAVSYDEKVKEIEQLKKEIADLEKTAANEASYGLLEQKKAQLAGLEKSIQAVTDAQEKLNKAQELAKTLNPETIRQDMQKIGLKLNEIEAQKKLADSYEKVYEKLQKGIPLTQQEAELNNRLIQQYPAFTKLINEKTGALGINLEALKSNLSAQEALAIVELNSLKSTATAEKLKTQELIKETENRVKAIQTEIDALEALNEARLAQINPDDPNALLYEKLYFKNIDRILKAKETLAELNNQLRDLKTVESAWTTLENLKPSDLLKGSGATTYTPSGSKKSSSSGSGSTTVETSPALIEKDRYFALNQELERTNNLLDQINTKEEVADQKTKVSLMQEEISLLQHKQDVLHNLAEEQRKERNELVQYLSGKGIQFEGTGDAIKAVNATEVINRKIDEANAHRFDKDKTLYNKLKDELDDLQNKYKRFIEIQSQDLPKVQSEWWQTEKAIGGTKQELQDLVNTAFESYQNYILDSVEKEIKALEDARDKARQTAQDKIDAIQKEIDKLEEENDALKEQEERQRRLDEIAKQREIVANIERERNVQIYQNGQWVWVADPRKLREETEKLQEMEKDYQDWEKEQSRQAQINRLRNQIKSIQDELALEEKKYQDKIDILRNYLDEEKDKIQKQKDWQITSITELTSFLANIEKSSYEERLKAFQDFAEKYNKIASELGLPTISLKELENLPNTSTTASASGGAKGYQKTESNEINSILDKMAKNSRDWWNASASEKERLTKENQSLAEELRKKGVEAKYDPSTGKWNVLQYAEGGIVDYTGIALVHGKPNSPEVVFNAEQAKRLYELVRFVLPRINIPAIATSTNGQVVNNYYTIERLIVQTNDARTFVDNLRRIIK